MKLFDTVGHLRDQALLLQQHDALRRGALRRMDAHLDHCPACRLRRQVLLETDGHPGAATRPAAMPMPDAARLRLQAVLAETTSARRPEPTQRSWRATLLHPVLWLQLGAIAMLLVFAVNYRLAATPLRGWMAAYDQKGPRPNRTLTPGSTSSTTVAELCRPRTDASDNEDLDPHVPPAKQHAVFRAYGVDESSARAYQLDFLINPQLGGNDRIENLWPEPYESTVWNAAAKDALEARLHGMVCSRQVDLQTAQRDISSDWIAAYRKYFRTAQPPDTASAADAEDRLAKVSTASPENSRQ